MNRRQESELSYLDLEDVTEDEGDKFGGLSFELVEVGFDSLAFFVSFLVSISPFRPLV